jgi:hypothetical protein
LAKARFPTRRGVCTDFRAIPGNGRDAAGSADSPATSRGFLALSCEFAAIPEEEPVSRRLKQAAVVFVVIFAAAQLIRPERANPAIDPSRTIQAHVGTASGLAAVLDRACRDCHSNETVWPWYTHIAPLSWLMAAGVKKGREAVNFSEWGAYLPEQRRILLALSCQDASEGKMPGPYARLRPKTRLSAQDVETICAAARQAEAHTAGSR